MADQPDAPIFPRAPTRTWMFLTFVLFVGVAVVGIGLYILFVLRQDIESAQQQVLRDQAERIAILVEQTASSQERSQVVEDILRLTNLRLTVVAPDSIYLDQDQESLTAAELQRLPEVEQALGGEVGYASRARPDGTQMVYVALPRPESGYIVRVGQEEPLLFALADGMQVTLLAGMIAALVLALIGSWIASDKVTEPIKAISQRARAISEGTFDEMIQVETRASEIQDLAKSLNRMSLSYQEKIDELERLARMQTEFIGNVSHEVRNPIFAIGGYLEALATPGLPDPQRRRYAEKALLNLQRLNNLFN
ncbi:MAG: histidine kinase dimerization/phospho-acceptor domain-containing protein, partial [Bacteroidota bacterium]